MSEDSMFGQSSGGARYFTVTKGKFSQRVDEGNARDDEGNLKPAHRKRKLTKGANEGKEVYEFTCDNIVGKITRVDVNPTDFGKQLSVSFTGAGGQVVVVSSPLKNDNGSLTSFASSFGDQIGLVDFSSDVKLGLYKKEGVVKGIFFEQDGTFIPSPNNNPTFKSHISNRPQPTMVKDIDGTDKYDWTKPAIWQYEQIQKAISDLAAMGVGEEVSPPEIGEEAAKTSVEDNLPF